MPSRNVLKVDVQDSYYHVYACGNSKGKVFPETADYEMFMSLLRRYLSAEEAHDPYGAPYPNFYNKIELVAYCLMPNHFHLLVYQHHQGAMSAFMRSVLTSYSRYFNKKYGLSGALFESRYKASRISSHAYLMHISRYIHLNPRNWREYPYSSIQEYFIGTPEWLESQQVIDLFGSLPIYADFLDDYSDFEESLETIKDELAD
jgi:putative transposase